MGQELRRLHVRRRIVQVEPCRREHLLLEPHVERIARADERLQRAVEVGRLHVGDQMLAGRQWSQVPQFLADADAALRTIELFAAAAVQLPEKRARLRRVAGQQRQGETDMIHGSLLGDWASDYVRSRSIPQARSKRGTGHPAKLAQYSWDATTGMISNAIRSSHRRVHASSRAGSSASIT